MKQRVVYLAISLLATSSLTAQEVKKWTLNDCIEYALEKNIQLQQDKISLEERCGCKDCESNPLPQPIVQYRTQRNKPSVSGKQQYCKRH